MIEKSHRYKLSPVCEWLVIVLFLVAIVAPGGVHLMGTSGTTSPIKAIENRSPASVPKLPGSSTELSDFPKSVEDFVNDHFGFRTFLNALNSSTMAFLGSSASEKILVGKSGWLFHNDTILNNTEEYRGAVAIDEAELDRWVDETVKRRNYLRDRDIPMIVSIFPIKHTVYPEFLPDWIERIGPNRMDRLLKKIQEETDLNLVDATPSMIEAKQKADSALYFKTDSHWNHSGSFVAYQKIMEAVTSYFPKASLVGRDDFEVEEVAKGRRDLMRQHNYWRGNREPYTSVRMTVPSHVRFAEMLDETGRQRVDPERSKWGTLTTIVYTDLDEAPRVLVFGDSFTNALVPYFNESFQEVMYTHHLSNSFSAEMVEMFKPDIVLINLVEKALSYRPRNRRSTGIQFDAAEAPQNPLDEPSMARWSPEIQHIPFGTQPLHWIRESGFHQTQNISRGPVRWTDGHAKLAVPLDTSVSPTKLEISLIAWGDRVTDLKVLINGTEVLDERFSAGEFFRTVDLGAISLDEVAEIELASDTVVPAGLNAKSSDSRSLGVCVTGIRLLNDSGSLE